MKTPNPKELDQLLADISTIKSVLKQNASVLRQMFLPRHFRFLSALGGIVIMADCYLYHRFNTLYGDFGHFPSVNQNIFTAAIIISFILLGVVKWAMWTRSIKQSGSNIDISRFFREFFSSQIIHLYLPLIVLITILSIYFSVRDQHYYIIPTIAIGTGLLYNAIGAATRIRQYLISGYWIIITGAMMLARPVSGPVAISVTLGLSLLIFALIPAGKE